MYNFVFSPADFFGSCFEMRKLEDSFTCSGTKCKKVIIFKIRPFPHDPHDPHISNINLKVPLFGSLTSL